MQIKMFIKKLSQWKNSTSHEFDMWAHIKCKFKRPVIVEKPKRSEWLKKEKRGTNWRETKALLSEWRLLLLLCLPFFPSFLTSKSKWVLLKIPLKPSLFIIITHICLYTINTTITARNQEQYLNPRVLLQCLLSMVAAGNRRWEKQMAIQFLIAASPVPRVSQNLKASSPLFKFIAEWSGLMAQLQTLGGGARLYSLAQIFGALWPEQVANVQLCSEYVPHPPRDY